MQDNDFSRLSDWDTVEDSSFSLSSSIKVPVAPPIKSPKVIKPVVPQKVTPSNSSGITVTTSDLNVPKPKLLGFQGVDKKDATPVKAPASLAPKVVRPAGLNRGTGWERIATEIKTLMEFPNKSVMHVHIDGHDKLIIDPMYKAYSWGTDKANFPTAIGGSHTELIKVDAGDPPALNGTGEDITALFWLIGSNAFNGEMAPWLRSNERYKLMRWPNLTEFDLSLDQIYITSVLGSTPSSIDELVLSSGGDRAEVVNTINALSLMGILSVHPFQGAANILRFGNKKDGLFSKLRRKIGW